MKKKILILAIATLFLSAGVMSCAKKEPKEMTNIEIIEEYGSLVNKAIKNIDDAEKQQEYGKRALELTSELNKRNLTDEETSKFNDFKEKAEKAQAEYEAKQSSSSSSSSSFDSDSDDDSDDDE